MLGRSGTMLQVGVERDAVVGRMVDASWRWTAFTAPGSAAAPLPVEAFQRRNAQ
jgi:hypothetical protein